MALGNIRYQAEFDTVYGVNYKIQIYDSDHTGSATDFKVRSPGFSLKYNGEGKQRFDTIKASSCSIFAISEDAAFDTFTRNIREGAQGRFRVQILRANENYWRGTILGDVGSEMLESHPNKVTLRAVDGLTFLKDIPYNRDVFFGNLGLEKHILIIQNMLRYYSNTYDFYGASDIILRTCVNWYESDQPTPASNIDPLEYTANRLNVFSIFQSGITKYKTAFQVLNEYCRLWGARLFQSKGVWCFFQESGYRNSATFRNYRPDTTTPADNASIDTMVSRAGTKQDGQAFIMLSGARQSFYPTLKKTVTIYGDWSNNVLFNQNYTLAAGSTPTRDADVAFVPLIADSSLQVQFNCKVQFPITTQDPFSGVYYWGNPPNESLDYILRVAVVLKVGSYYYTNSGWSLSEGYYNTHFSAGAYFMAVNAALGGDQNIVLPIEFIAPNPPAAGQLSFGAFYDIWEGDGVTQNSGTTTFQNATTVNFVFQDSSGPFNPNIFQGNTITFIQDGDIFGEREFKSENQTSTANAVLDLGTQLMGDGPQAWNDGGLKVSSDGVNFSLGVESSWTAFSTGITSNISKILVNQFQAGQQQTIPILQAGFVMRPTANEYIEFADSLVFESQSYIANGWTYRAYEEVYKGEWYLTTSDFTGLTETEEFEETPAEFIQEIGF